MESQLISGNSLPRHLRPTLMTVPSNAQLLETTALPMAVIVQPFAQLRYDEAPIPLVSSWISGQSAFDRPTNPAEDEGPPRCDKCRGYINPWARFTDGGQKWMCNLCNTSNPGKLPLHTPVEGSQLRYQSIRITTRTYPPQGRGSIIRIAQNYYTAQSILRFLATTGQFRPRLLSSMWQMTVRPPTSRLQVTP
jgi:hypothetical protein